MDTHTKILKVFQKRISKEIDDFICHERRKFETRCEDRVSKKIKYLSKENIKGEIQPVELDDNVAVCENTDPTIVIILESPHKDEYASSKTEKRPAPARGTTGRNINQYFISLLKSDKELSFGDWRVGLINPIQYSCSFGGILPTKRKEDVFNTLFCGAIMDDFVCRLDLMRKRKKTIVINCCTKNNSSEIDDVLKSNSISFIKMAHPSSRLFVEQCHCVSSGEHICERKIEFSVSSASKSFRDTLSIEKMRNMILES